MNVIDQLERERRRDRILIPVVVLLSAIVGGVLGLSLSGGWAWIAAVLVALL